MIARPKFDKTQIGSIDLAAAEAWTDALEKVTQQAGILADSFDRLCQGFDRAAEGWTKAQRLSPAEPPVAGRPSPPPPPPTAALPASNENASDRVSTVAATSPPFFPPSGIASGQRELTMAIPEATADLALRLGAMARQTNDPSNAAAIHEALTTALALMNEIASQAASQSELRQIVAQVEILRNTVNNLVSRASLDRFS